MKEYLQIAPKVFDCKVCPTRCDGISKMNYQFADDAAFSERYEYLLIDHINQFTSFKGEKTEEKGYPDIKVQNKRGGIFILK